MDGISNNARGYRTNNSQPKRLAWILCRKLRSMNERVVISGVGMVTPLGIGKKAFSRRLFRGDSGISPITSFDTSQFLSRLGAEVHGFIPKDFISVKNLRRMDRISSITAASARMATEDAGFGIDASNRDRVGILSWG